MNVELRLTSSWMARERQEGWTDLTGQSPEEMLGWGWLMAVHSEDREHVVTFGARARANGRSLESTYRLRTARGAFRDLTVKAVRVTDVEGSDGKNAEWLLTHRPLDDDDPVDLGADLALDWNLVAEQLEEGVITADREGRITYVNRIARKLHGIAEIGVRPEGYSATYKLFTVDGDPYLPSELPLARAVRGETVKDASWIIRRPGGEERVVRGDAMPIRDRTGQQIGSLLTCRDVSAEEDLRAELEAERQILQRVFQESPVFKAVLRGPEHRFELVNPAYRRLVGDRKLVGLGVREAFPDLADQAAFFELLDQVYATGEAYRAEEERIILRRRDEAAREERFVDLTYQPLVDERGAVTGILLTGVDVTDQVRRRREEESLRDQLEESTRRLREREERFREIADNIDGVFWTSAPDKSEIEYLSPAFERIWGLERTHVYEDVQRWKDSIHPEDRERVAEGIATQGEADQTLEYRIVRPDGDVRWIRTRSSPARDHEGRVRRIVGVSEDVTESVRMELRLRTSQKMEALGSMAGRVAHDFNNVLTSVYGFTGLALTAVKEGRDPSDELREINASVERASALSAQLLAFSRDEDAEPEPVDLNARLREIRRMLEVLAGESVKVSYDLDGGDASVRLAENEIQQIVVNLVANARDAMPGGGALRLVSRVLDLEGDDSDSEIDGMPAGRYVELRVSDQGVGVPPDLVDRIFDPFFTTKESGKGTGLGLSTVFEIVRQRGGWIEVESTVGEGTDFRVLLPVSDVRASDSSEESVDPTGAVGSPDTSADEKRAEEDPSDGEGGSETILVVDDDPRILSLVEKLLVRQGYEVVPCANPAEAERAFNGGGVDVVLTDLGMEGGGAATLVRALGNGSCKVPIVFMSGHDRSELERHGISRDAHFVEKPFDPVTLRDTIREVIRTV